MNWEEIAPKLAEPFPVNKIHWRVGARTRDKSRGIALAYVDARDVMKRFDDVCGGLWQDDYPLADSGLLICRIGLKIEGEWRWRSNGAGDTDVEAEKGKASDAFKRAGVLWGVARYLYALPNEWIALTNDGRELAQVPKLPKWATPEGYREVMEQRKAANQ